MSGVICKRFTVQVLLRFEKIKGNYIGIKLTITKDISVKIDIKPYFCTVNGKDHQIAGSRKATPHNY